jgi:xylulokinase
VTPRSYLGLDIGTSAVKALLVDGSETVQAAADCPLETSHPHALWAEQDPESWWRAALDVMHRVRKKAPDVWENIAGIGLSGQMHGAVLLGRGGQALRPAILWNDARAHQEAVALAQRLPEAAQITGSKPMASFVAPKLLWLARYEPETMSQIRHVVLPKDYVRLKLTGEIATDMCDASGTGLLDVGDRRWWPKMLETCGIGRSQLPSLLEGSAVSGRLRDGIADDLGLARGLLVAAGSGDAASGAIGIGAIEEGDAFLSLGTSAQIFVARSRYVPRPQYALHAYCHGLPERWFEMAALLNGAGALAWAAEVFALPPGDLVDEAESRAALPSSLLFLPYLSGERTPHDDPLATGAFLGLTPGTNRAQITAAVLEGVAFAIAESHAVLASSGAPIRGLAVIGGGARSAFWLKIISAALDLPLTEYSTTESSAARGAARLARLAHSGGQPGLICKKPTPLRTVWPDPRLADAYKERLSAFRRFYGAVKPLSC